ncbi:MAG: DUF2948 family protein [Azospirillum sp.]|nr:DUF2948 family protein [Azospirillum sp.]
MSPPIRLRAEDDDDLAVISACLQDALVPISEMCFLPEERRFVMVVNRFKWENAGATPMEPNGAGQDGEAPFERTNCGVRIDGVERVQRRALDLRDRRQILNILALTTTGDGLELVFSGGGALLFQAATWQCCLKDIGEAWPTARRPCHDIDKLADIGYTGATAPAEAGDRLPQ